MNIQRNNIFTTTFQQKPYTSTNIKKQPTIHKRVKIASCIGSSIGLSAALGTIVYNSKKNGLKSLKSIKFNNKDILHISASSILGGLSGGIIFDKKENTKSKIREAVQQFAGNTVAPLALVSLNLTLLNKAKTKMPQLHNTKLFLGKLNKSLKSLPEVFVTITSLIMGMELGNKLVNNINNKIFNESKNYKVKLSDYSSHSDNISSAAQLVAENSNLQNTMGKIAPLAYLSSGYKVGVSGNNFNQ